MIVQPPAEGEREARVVMQLEHARLAAAFARAWGGGRVAPLQPRELVLHLVEHHDDGWDVVDAAVGRDERTGLPWNLVSTPLPQILKTSRRSPELAERRHPYCGLLAPERQELDRPGQGPVQVSDGAVPRLRGRLRRVAPLFTHSSSRMAQRHRCRLHSALTLPIPLE